MGISLTRIFARSALQSSSNVKDKTITHPEGPPRAHAAEAPACVVTIYGGELGRRIKLPPREIIIGRDEDNAIHVALETISRRHARLFPHDGAHCVEDLGSTNGTFVNEQEIVQPTPLRNGDLIRCGGAVFKFIEGGNVEALYHEEIYRLTITDGLTQVANKRHFADFLEREIARATRHGRPLALVIFDVDLFKRTNDEYGHLAGDRVLQGIASVVARQVRRDELIARYGGEEFAVVLPETSVEEAALFCERIRAEVEGERFEFDGEPLRATISLGAAALEHDDTVDTLVARADAHLYRAKQTGRNRVVAATGRSDSASAGTESSPGDAARR
jgi:diguanylate cyclase (GGDEF)-like protein